MKIVIAGGQTGGPVMPLIALAEHIKQDHPKTQIYILDTPTSTGKHVAKKNHYNFIYLTILN